MCDKGGDCRKVEKKRGVYWWDKFHGRPGIDSATSKDPFNMIKHATLYPFNSKWKTDMEESNHDTYQYKVDAEQDKQQFHKFMNVGPHC